MASGRAGAAALAPVISVEHLRVRYADRLAVADVSFEVAAGEVLGLIGPNGAGKTTTLSVLSTLRRPDGGAALIGGHSVAARPAAVRRVLGVVPQSLALYPTLTARENAFFFARALGLRGAAVRRAGAEALRLVGLEERQNDIVSSFSGGMQRRLNLACGLMHAPRVLLLDEPTVGVDPQSRERIFAAVRQQAAAGAAIVYSTHYMEEAERLCDRVVLIDHGRVIATGTPADMIGAIDPGMRLDVITRRALPADWLDAVAGARLLAAAARPESAADGNPVRVLVDDLAVAPRVLERAAALGGEVLEFHVHHSDLQDVFLSLTGRELRD